MCATNFMYNKRTTKLIAFSCPFESGKTLCCDLNEHILQCVVQKAVPVLEEATDRMSSKLHLVGWVIRRTFWQCLSRSQDQPSSIMFILFLRPCLTNHWFVAVWMHSAASCFYQAKTTETGFVFTLCEDWYWLGTRQPLHSQCRWSM